MCVANGWAMLLHPLAWWLAAIVGVRVLLGGLGRRPPHGHG